MYKRKRLKLYGMDGISIASIPQNYPCSTTCPIPYERIKFYYLSSNSKVKPLLYFPNAMVRSYYNKWDCWVLLHLQDNFSKRGLCLFQKKRVLFPDFVKGHWDHACGSLLVHKTELILELWQIAHPTSKWAQVNENLHAKLEDLVPFTQQLCDVPQAEKWSFTPRKFGGWEALQRKLLWC